MKTIEVSGRLQAKVDDDLYDELQNYIWHESGKGYVATSIWLGNQCMPRQKEVYMHRLIAEADHQQDVDHINGDRMDNRRSNLRIASRSQNLANQSVRARNSVGVKGVGKSGSKYYAQITIHKEHHYLGVFDTIEDASRAYSLKALSAWGEFARTQ